MLDKKIADIVWKFICEDKTNYEKLWKNLRKIKTFYNTLQFFLMFIATVNSAVSIRKVNFK